MFLLTTAEDGRALVVSLRLRGMDEMVHWRRLDGLRVVLSFSETRWAIGSLIRDERYEGLE